MPRNIALSPPSSVADRRQPLLESQDFPSRGSSMRLAEVAGGTTAECAAVCCCCPCGLVNLLVLAVYKLPAGLCRKALRRKRRRKLKKKGVLPRSQDCSCDELELQIRPVTAPFTIVDAPVNKEFDELEKEMWEKFYSGGFWRSSSRRSDASTQ